MGDLGGAEKGAPASGGGPGGKERSWLWASAGRYIISGASGLNISRLKFSHPWTYSEATLNITAIVSSVENQG